MLIQYAKFLKLGQETLWKRPVPSINYIEVSKILYPMSRQDTLS